MQSDMNAVIKWDRSDILHLLLTWEENILSLFVFHIHTGQPKVAFSAGIANTGYIGPYGDWTTLKFNNIYTNIGEAYNPNTGTYTSFTFSHWFY